MKIDYTDKKIVDDVLSQTVKSETFSNIILNKESLYDRFAKSIDNRFKILSSQNEIKDDEIHVKWSSNITYKYLEQQKLFLNKLYYCSVPFMWGNKDSFIFKGTNKEFLELNKSSIKLDDCFISINDIASFQTLVELEFDTRFFNEIFKSSDRYIKKSNNINKIRDEFNFLSTVSEDFSHYYIPVHDYEENDLSAQYSMPKMTYLDMSKRHINGKMSSDDIEIFFKSIDSYFSNIKKKTYKVTGDEFSFIYKKTKDRLEEIKQHSIYDKLNIHFKNNTTYKSFDLIYEELLNSLNDNEKEIKAAGSVISHGDLCFPNILASKYYDKLIFIDPRGGNFNNSYRSIYYDFAKLSHSILGNYDFILNDLAHLRFNDSLQIEIVYSIQENEFLSISFKEYLKKIGIDYKILRLIEASLFLSMLPLHCENENKVLMLAIRGSEILKDHNS